MLKRLLIVALCILSLPLLASFSSNGKSITPAPFAPIAIAGHSNAGGAWCNCGCPECTCEPGETPISCGGNRATADGGGSSDRDSGPRKAPGSELDLSTAAFLLALALLAWTRFRP